MRHEALGSLSSALESKGTVIKPVGKAIKGKDKPKGKLGAVSDLGVDGTFLGQSAANHLERAKIHRDRGHQLEMEAVEEESALKHRQATAHLRQANLLEHSAKQRVSGAVGALGLKDGMSSAGLKSGGGGEGDKKVSKARDKPQVARNVTAGGLVGGGLGAATGLTGHPRERQEVRERFEQARADTAHGRSITGMHPLDQAHRELYLARGKVGGERALQATGRLGRKVAPLAAAGVLGGAALGYLEPAPVKKAGRRFDPEADRQRRLGLYSGLAGGGGDRDRQRGPDQPARRPWRAAGEREGGAAEHRARGRPARRVQARRYQAAGSRAEPHQARAAAGRGHAGPGGGGRRHAQARDQPPEPDMDVNFIHKTPSRPARRGPQDGGDMSNQSRRNRLFDLEIDEVSAVDRPASQRGLISIAKSLGQEDDMRGRGPAHLRHPGRRRARGHRGGRGRVGVHLPRGRRRRRPAAAGGRGHRRRCSSSADQVFDLSDAGAEDEAESYADVGKAGLGQPGLGRPRVRRQGRRLGQGDRPAAASKYVKKNPMKAAAIAGGAGVAGGGAYMVAQKSLGTTVLEELSKAVSAEERDQIVAKMADEVERTAAENEELRKAFEEERDIRITEAFVAKAAEYELPVDPQVFGPILKAIAEVLDDDELEVLDTGAQLARGPSRRDRLRRRRLQLRGARRDLRPGRRARRQGGRPACPPSRR